MKLMLPVLICLIGVNLYYIWVPYIQDPLIEQLVSGISQDKVLLATLFAAAAYGWYQGGAHKPYRKHKYFQKSRRSWWPPSRQHTSFKARPSVAPKS